MTRGCMSGGARVRYRALQLATAALAVCTISGVARADEIDFDDFESVQPLMEPFTIDYFQPGQMPGEFDGFSLMDVSSWIGHAGNQDGRDRCYFGSDPADRNVALVADPDEADDGGNSDMGDSSNPLFNSYARVTVDTTGLDLSTLELSFDFDFVCEDTQTGIVEISFDGGNSYETILEIDSAVIGENDAYSTNPAVVGDDDINQGILVDATYVAGTDFTAPASADSVIVQFGCIRASNDWWFAIDNVSLSTTADGQFYFEDFERDPTLADLPFSSANPSSDSDGTDWSKNVPPEWELDNSENLYDTDRPDFDPSDGTDWTRDLDSIGWTINNDGMKYIDDEGNEVSWNSPEGAYDGGAVLDALSWAYQTAGGPPSDADLGNVNSGWGQERTQFSDDDIFGLRNSVLVFDPDQAHDGTSGVDGNRAYTSFAEKTYDVSNFDNDTLSITLEWEIRVEARSVNVIEVSFDGGASWLNIFELDANDLSDPALQTRFSDFLAAQFDGGTPDVVDSGDVVRTYQEGPDTITISDFAPAGNVDDSNTMILRIGIVGGDNDWWFAVDDIRVEADPQGFVIGDANGDGEANFSDINAGVAAILGQIYSPEMDVNEDLAVDFSDINGFVNAVLGN